MATIASRAADLVKAALDAVKAVPGAFGKATTLATHSTPVATTVAAAGVPIKASASLANTTVKMALVMAKWPFNAIETFCKRMPVVSSAVGLLAGLGTFAGVSSYFGNKTRDSAAERTQTNAMAEVATAQQKYMNSVSPEEFALMQTRIASKGHMTDNVMASKQAETAPSQAAG